MEYSSLQTLQTFTLDSLPNLDIAVLGALERFSEESLPAFKPATVGKRPLVIGSGNALTTGRILFRAADAEFADESTYQEELNTGKDINSIVIISASGGKHAVGIAKELEENNLPLWLLTNNEDAPARERINSERVVVFLKNREPYTYNVSTYFSMIFSETRENPEEVRVFITNTVEAEIPENLEEYDSFYFIIPPKFHLARDMFLTKFDELFGSQVTGRVFTYGETKHAKTVVPSERELFISFGETQTSFGIPENRVTIHLPLGAGYGAFLAVGYYVIGRIQSQMPGYFKENIARYTEEASRLFNQDIQPIVE